MSPFSEHLGLRDIFIEDARNLVIENSEFLKFYLFYYYLLLLKITIVSVACVHGNLSLGVLRGYKKVSDHLELEL